MAIPVDTAPTVAGRDAVAVDQRRVSALANQGIHVVISTVALAGHLEAAEAAGRELATLAGCIGGIFG